MNSIDAFKNLLKNYKFYKYIELPNVKSNIQRIEYDMTGVKAIRYDKSPTIPNPELTAQRRHELSEQLDHELAKKELMEIIIQFCDDVLERLGPTMSEPLMKICCDGKTYKQVAEELHMADATLFEKIFNALQKVLK